jgi:muramoyltetrapeptide carboxypeptidase LdcA involved in peptidoglycan recycling
MKQFVKLPKLSKGDQVAVISPSAGLPGIFPWVQDLGMERLRDIFGLVPIEYPTTRIMGASLQDRAKDVMAAFADPANKAVFTSIGGDDQIKLIKYLDPQTFLDNPKPFFGYSDNTHLHNFLWNLGIPSFYGGAIMTQFAFQNQMNDITIHSLNHALFDEGEYELEVADQYCDEGLDWSVIENLTKSRKMEPNDGLIWDGTTDTEGILWGGCVESLIVQSTAGKYLPKIEDLEGTILFIETAEDIPDHWVIDYLLTGFGERGWFDKFQAVLVGRPKAWELDKQNSTDIKAEYRKLQRETVLKTVRQYNKYIPVVQNVDFGHTDPQIIMPNGGRVRILGSSKKIFLI